MENPASYGNHEIEQVSFIKGFLITGTYSYTCLLCVWKSPRLIVTNLIDMAIK